jgi:uncharacterized membrane protein YphA (DoxX/SURF4 family)
MQRNSWPTILRVAAVLAVVVLLLAMPASGVERSGTLAGGLLAGSAGTWRLVLAAPLLAHGLAHLSGLVAPFTRRDVGFAEQPWSFAHGVTVHSAAGRAFGLLWLASAAGLVMAGVGLLLGLAWWAAAALAAAALSLAVIVTWWRAVPPGAKVGAGFDVLILLAAVQAV